MQVQIDPAALHRWTPDQRVWDSGVLARRHQARARSRASRAAVSSGRDLLRRDHERARRSGGRGTDHVCRNAVETRQGAVRRRQCGAARRAAGGSRARQFKGAPHPNEGCARHVASGVANGALAATIAAAGAQRQSRRAAASDCTVGVESDAALAARSARVCLTTGHGAALGRSGQC